MSARLWIVNGIAAFVSAFAALTSYSLSAGEPPAQRENASGDLVGQLQAERGELLFSDDFERSEIGGEWIEHFEVMSLQDGILVTQQLPDKHAAVARHMMALQNSVIFDYDLRFADAKRAVFVVNGEDQHVFHVSFREKEIGLGVSVQDYVHGRVNAIAIGPRKKGQWLSITLVLVEDQLEAIVDGVSVVTLKSPGLTTAKDLFQFWAAGDRVEHDNVEVWSVDH